jgi:hypothetical protein
MKKVTLFLTCAFLSASTLVFADDKKVTTTTTTTYGSGTITEYVPGSTFIVKESAGPVTYSYGDSVTYVTRSGKVIPEADLKTRVKVGTPVKVYYSGPAEKRVITRVMVDQDDD